MSSAERTSLVVGLTGGIASGKTSVGELFAQRRVPLVDADVVARDVVVPGSPGLAAVAAAFGAEVIGADGALDRGALRRRVFESPQERLRLEALLHPLIRAEMSRQLSQLRAPYVMLIAPLLLEADMTDLVERVLVVDVPAERQLERVMARDGSSRAEAENILASQISRQQRLDRADDVIVNDGPLSALAPQIDRLHQLYLQLAAAKTAK